jgi:hypothetical protein
MSLVIGVVGFIGSGKGTVGNYLCEKYAFTHDSFASPLKDVVSAIFGWERHLLEGDTSESRKFRDLPDIWWEENLNWSNTKFSSSFPKFSPRVCLQLFGTEILRKEFDDKLWILSLKNRIRNLTTNVVITDCRFPNEITTIKKQGGFVIRIKRGNEPSWYPIALGANTSSFIHKDEYLNHMLNLGIHQSEWAWIGQAFDYEITNDTVVENLYSQIDKIMENHNNGRPESS